MKYFATRPRVGPLRVIIIGGPASGRSTLAERLSKEYNATLVQAFEIVQKHFGQNQDFESADAFHRLAFKKLRSGKAIPGDMLIELLSSELENPSGWILDGCPMTRLAAVKLAETQKDIDHVIVLQRAEPVVPNDERPVALPEDLSLLEDELDEVIKVFEETDAKIHKFKVIPAELGGSNATYMQLIQMVDPFISKAEKLSENLFEFGSTYDYCPVTLANRKILRKGEALYAAQFRVR
jgi:adenylate kinase family enzyme